MKRHLVMASLLALTAAPAMAQNKGTIEIGAFVKFTDYDNSFGTARKNANSWGGGGRLGYFLGSKWALELDGSANATDVIEFFNGFESTALTYYPFHLRLVFNQRLGENSPFTWLLGAGPGYNRYGKDVAGEPGFKGDDWGLGALTGFRAMLTNWLAFRIDGTLDYIPSPNNGSDEIVTQWAMKEVERMGLLQMDFLGLSTLTLINDALAEIKRTENIVLDIDNVPLDPIRLTFARAVVGH